MATMRELTGCICPVITDDAVAEHIEECPVNGTYNASWDVEAEDVNSRLDKLEARIKKVEEKGNGNEPA